MNVKDLVIFKGFCLRGKAIFAPAVRSAERGF
jgi:hypothetical protein